ncbi:EpsG family protein [Vibrio renipiscarius]|uniref:EpsG family protein n=1 Tax=Vibrio renipiscarius TaxID=1461322 RepID=A0A0C2P413_9VIBR|nr:hypothetical protein OJ16_02620 [Vibrio renipiscarius]KII81578.1 hypothetical protein PL18_03145 [Vibrio renipiscarius]
MLYTIMFFIMLINVVLSFSSWERYKYFIISMSTIYCIWLMLYSGLREPGSSPDDINYIYNLYYGKLDFEWAFACVTDFFRFYRANESNYFLFVSMLTQVSLFVAIYIYSPRFLAFALLIYSSHVYLYRDLVQIRAGVAYNILLLSMILLINRKHLLSMILYFFSIGFHKTSSLSLIPIILNKVHVKTKYVVMIALLIYFSSFINFGTYLINHFPLLTSMLSENAIATYLEEGNEYAKELSPLNPTTIKLLVVFMCVSYFRDRIPEIKENNLLYYSYALSLIFISFFNSFNVFASRMSSMFAIVEIILIPAMVFYLRSKLLLFVFISIYTLQFSINYYLKGMSFGGFLYLL